MAKHPYNCSTGLLIFHLFQAMNIRRLLLKRSKTNTGVEQNNVKTLIIGIHIMCAIALYFTVCALTCTYSVHTYESTSNIR